MPEGDGGEVVQEIHAGVRRGRTPATWQAYQRDLRAFESWIGPLGLTILNCTSENVQKWVDEAIENGTPVRTVRRRLVGLHQFYLEAERLGLIDSAPTHEVNRPQVASRQAGLSLEVARSLLLASRRAAWQMGAGIADEALVCLTLLHRISAGEAGSLMAADVDLDDLVVQVRGVRARTVQVTTATGVVLAALVHARVAATGGPGYPTPLFVTRSGKPMTRWDVWRRMRSLGRSAGVEVPSLTLYATPAELERHLGR